MTCFTEALSKDFIMLFLSTSSLCVIYLTCVELIIHGKNKKTKPKKPPHPRLVQFKVSHPVGVLCSGHRGREGVTRVICKNRDTV